MKLLIAAGNYPNKHSFAFTQEIGGPSSYAAKLVEELPLGGFDLKIVHYGDKNDRNKEKSVEIFSISRHVSLIVRYLFYFWKIFQLLKWADLVYVQGPISEGVPVWLATRLRKKKYVLKIVGDYAWEQGIQRFNVKELLDDFLLKRDYPWPVKFLRWAQKIVAQKADKIITPSKYLKTVVAGWGIDAQKINVIYNAVESKAVDPIKHDGEKWIVSVGRLVPWKGFDILIEIMPDLLKEFSNLKLKIIGDGPDMENIKYQISNIKLDDAVELIGALSHDKTLSYIKSADVFVLNSGYEGLSHVILEALYLGTPVLASDCGGNPELLPRENLFTYNNKEEIINKISAVLKNKENFVIDNKILEKFRLDNMIENTKKILCVS